MVLIILIIVGLAIRLATKGSVQGIGDIRIRGEAFLVCVFVLTFLLPLASGPMAAVRPLVLPAWVVLMALLLAVCILNAREHPGFRVMAAGVASNLAVISLNGAMPVWPKALVLTGSTLTAVRPSDVFHSLASSATKLALLGDVLPLPGPVGFRAVNSIGDLLMFVGVILILATSSSTRPVRVAAGKGFV